MKPQLVWIEDDVRYVKLLSLELGHRFEFEVFNSLDEQVFKRLEQFVDAVIVDMHLAQGRQGPEIFKKIRDLGFLGPIFVLSNDESVLSKVEMLSLGVDDYLWKVMPTQELELRLSNSIQRYQEKLRLLEGVSDTKATLGLIALDGFELNPQKLVAELNGQPIDLSKIEFRIFSAILRSHPEPVHLESLKREAWGQTVVESGTVNTFIWKMNKKTKGWPYRIVRSSDGVSLREIKA